MVKVPVKLDDDEGHNDAKKGAMEVPMLEPHTLLHHVHTVLGLTVEQESVRSYWRRASEHGAGWACQQRNHDAIPVGLYADETKYGLHESQEKILGFFMNLVLFRPRSIRLSRFLLFSLRSKFILPGSETLYPLVAHIVWSMVWASKGLFPTVGMFGSALSEKQQANAGKQLGAEFYVTELRGDLPGF